MNHPASNLPRLAELIQERPNGWRRLGLAVLVGLPILAAGILTWGALDRLERLTQRRLETGFAALLESTSRTVRMWAAYRLADATTAALSPQVQAAVARLNLPPRRGEEEKEAAAAKELARRLEPILAGYGYVGFAVATPDRLTLAASRPELVGRPHPLGQRAGLWDDLLAGRPRLATPYPALPPSPDAPGRPLMGALAPFRDAAGRTTAILILDLDPGGMFSQIISLESSFPDSDLFAYDAQGEVLTRLKFEAALRGQGRLAPDQSAILGVRLKAGQPPERGPTPGSQVEGRRSGVNMAGYVNYRGETVVGSWRWLPELELGLVVEMERDEAFVPFRATRTVLFVVVTATAAVFLIFIGLSARGRRRSLELAELVSSVNDELVKTVAELRLTEKELKLAAAYAAQNPFPVLRLAGDGTILYANQGSQSILNTWGRRVGQRAPEDWVEIVGVGLIIRAAREVEVKAGGRVYSLLAAPAADQEYVNVYGIDITERKQAEESLRLAGRVFETTHEGIIITDPEGIIEAVNPAFTTITGYRPHETLGKVLRQLDSSREDPDILAQIWDSLKLKGQWQGENWNRRKNGEAYPQWQTISAIKDDRGQTIHLVSVFTDITAIKRSQEAITHQAYHDALTGLPNRLLFNDRLEVALRQARRSSKRLALIFLDLDRFKAINDSLGHDVGDLLLKAVGERLQGCLREEDTVARLGGDEFVILLRSINLPVDAEEVARKVTQVLAAPFVLRDQSLTVTSSLGLTLYPEHGREAEALMKNADLAMYQAKSQGRNNYQIFSPGLETPAGQRVILETNLRRAMDQGELELYYQPVLALPGLEPVGLEALLRWPVEEGRKIDVFRLVQAAEETGLILPLGEWAFKEACARLEAWREVGLDRLDLAVNLSPKQLLAPGFAEFLDQQLQARRLEPVRFVLELTEESLMANFEGLQPILADLAGRGYRLALDRFGSGRTSLTYLQKLPLNVLKLDKALTKDLAQDQAAEGFVKAIAAMAHSLGLSVIAAGVESAEQVKLLQTAGCDQAQGFYLSPPLPGEEATLFLQAKTPLAADSFPPRPGPSEPTVTGV